MSGDKSSFIDEGDLSALEVGKKSELQLKNEKLFRELSEMRLNMRELKQENQWVRNTQSGLQEESYTLKQLLREKKALLLQANHDIKCANEEINRLEDVIVEKDALLSQLQEKSVEKEQRNEALQRTLHEKLQLFKDQEKLIQEMEKEKQNYVKQKIYQSLQTDQKIEHILEQIECKLNIQAGDSIISMIERMNLVTQAINQKNSEYQQKVKDYQRKMIKKDKKLANMDEQMKDLCAIVEEYKEQSEESKARIEKKEIQISQLRRKIKDKNDQWKKKNEKIIQAIGRALKQQNPLLENIKASMDEDGYELGVLLEQLSQKIRKNIKERQKIHLQQQKTKKLTGQVNLLKQQYDSLKIKYLILHRQYEAILADNQRLIKFNNLSSYRLHRNDNEINL